jgi:hypothetical protein
MSNLLFPQTHGMGWDIKKVQMFRTLINPSAVPGYETRVPMAADAIHRFEMNYKILFDNAQYDSLNTIEGFFRARRGKYDSFLLDLSKLTKNPAHASVTDQVLPWDANSNAPLVRTVSRGGGYQYNEAIFELAVRIDDDGTITTTVPTIKKNGTVQVAGSDYNLRTPAYVRTGALNANGITYSGYVVDFVGSLTTGDVVTADFGWAYRVRFDQDEQEFDQFFYLLWNLQQMTLQEVRG